MGLMSRLSITDSEERRRMSFSILSHAEDILGNALSKDKFAITS